MTEPVVKLDQNLYNSGPKLTALKARFVKGLDVLKHVRCVSKRIVFVARAMSGTENPELRPIMSPTLAQQEQFL